MVTRFFEALRDGDEEAVRNRVSRQPGFERFGSDPDEVWHDGEASARLWVQQMRELGAELGGGYPWHLIDEIVEAVSESRPDLSESSAPDGTVTIAFTDIEDSLRLNAFLGDRRWLDVLRAHNEVVKRTTEEHGGTVVKSQGDGFMLAFASARRAVACAQAIEAAVAETFRDPGSPIRVRIGLHVGETVHEADDHFGHAVNYAARVASAATGGEIVVSSLVYGLLAQTGEFEFDAAREVELKGIEGLQRVYPLASDNTQPSVAVE